MALQAFHPPDRLLTGEELLQLGAIGPCELIDGKIVPMAPTGAEHGKLEFRLGNYLSNFMAMCKRGWVLGGEVGLYTRRDPDRVRGADIVVTSRERLPEGTPKGFLQAAPDLIVEIMSPDDRWQYVRQKLEEYFSLGVEEVWIVEPENRTILRHRSPTDIQRLGEGDILAGEGLLEGFTLPLADLFAD